MSHGGNELGLHHTLLFHVLTLLLPHAPLLDFNSITIAPVPYTSADELHHTHRSIGGRQEERDNAISKLVVVTRENKLTSGTLAATVRQHAQDTCIRS